MKSTCTMVSLAVMSASLLSGGNVQKGEAIYTKSCKACHGAKGEGNPAIAKGLKVTIPHLGSKEVQSQSDADLTKTITVGKGKMRPVKTVAPADVPDVLSYMRTLGGK